MPTKDKLPVACFAPPLTDALLARYKAVVEHSPMSAEVRDAMASCLRCVEAWWELPESGRRGDLWKTVHRGKEVEFEVKPLEKEHVAALDAVTPWPRELDTLSTPKADGLFDSLEGEVRDVAFHLLWHAKEIALDREPVTQDKLAP